jgi:hypothetical protein
MLRFACFVAFVLAVTLGRSAGGAEAVFSLHAMEGKSAWDGALHTSREEPDVLAGSTPRLRGARTSTTEIGLQLAGIASSTRFGFVEAIYLPRDLSVSHAPLPYGFTTAGGTAWGGRFEAFVGRELSDMRGITPWIDVSVGVSLLSASLKLRHPTYGSLGETDYMKVDPIVAPRIGVRIPFAEHAALDLMARRDLIGPGKFYLGVAISLTTFRSDL